MFEIKTAEVADCDIINRLENACFSDPWSAGEIANAISSGQVLASLQGGEIAGYLVFSGDEAEIDIRILAVDEKFRRKGAAKVLIAELIMRFPKAAIWLEVRESNIAARSLYKLLGFEEKFVRKNYYEKPEEDAVVMAKWAEDNF
jgi:ribosomal-protein-alanine N-acetyltransferase